MNLQTEILIIGGGHAGCEAAFAAAKLGLKTILLTFEKKKIAKMPCNPAIGGIGKGHLVKEIDALGGIMAIAADRAGIQFRTLNKKKGVAVQATRAQEDSSRYQESVLLLLEENEKLAIVEGEAVAVLERKAGGFIVETDSGSTIASKCVVITVGTYLKGLMHTGFETTQGGSKGEKSSEHLTASLKKFGIEFGRLKTGTPPRLRKETIDFSVCTQQFGDDPPPFFRRGSQLWLPQQAPCHLTSTNETTHDIIRGSLDRSPLYSGVIKGIGPRYCPSIEDKVVRFKDKKSHLIFLEPVGAFSELIYPNGVSTSLPRDVQEDYLRSIKGLEQVEIAIYGYAVEYDFAFPTQCKSTLESKRAAGLFFAGQINGTSGYEEAAAQGLIAGANAALKILGREQLIVGRDEGYLGVMIDDLVTIGTDEPYRMFTSRAEFRLHLREDNAEYRLREKAFGAGLIDAEENELRKEKEAAIARERDTLAKIFLPPSEEINEKLREIGQEPLRKKTSAAECLRRPELNYQTLKKLLGLEPPDEEIQIQVETEIKYEGYLTRERERIEKLKKLEQERIPDNFDYNSLSGLRREVIQKLESVRPTTLGQASRIPGLTPAAIGLIHVGLSAAKRRKTPPVPRGTEEGGE